MSDRDRRYLRRPSPPPAAMRQRSPLNDLGEPVAAPDQTSAIMHRLGYVPVGAAERRRLRRQRVLTRSSLVLGLALMMIGALEMYSVSPAARHPHEITIPDALHEDVLRQQERFDRAIRTIRNLAPPPRPRTPLPPPELDEQLDRSAIGPVRWI